MPGRVVTDGKHLSLDGAPFKIRGVTYGSFVPRIDGDPFPDRTQVKKDFADMESAGINVVRTYTLPPLDVLELAEEMGLRLLIGLHYEDWRYQSDTGRKARRRVRDAGLRAVDEAVERASNFGCVLAIAVGNEVPADVVRVHGIGGVERVLSEFVERVHEAGQSMLATYCNFPTTEFLEVEGQDFFSFNVFLEDAEALRRYVSRLQIVSGDHPLVLTELGLASQIHGEQEQAESLKQQLRIADECGCAGATVFSWTDEWGVGGEPVEGWGFGITDSDRKAKPALEVVKDWASSTTRDLRLSWPRVSAIVCAHNAEELIGKCLASLRDSTYSDLEVIVCDDGSTDRTLEIARAFPVKVLELEHQGLGAARNAGIAAASGEIAAFIDADAFCHPEWAYYLALSLEGNNVVATGGPNLPLPNAGLVERAVANSPGGPMHVLVTDDRAEHVPGCNMAYKKDALASIGGFDPIYTAAGDDVDVCWKVLDRGHEIAFAPAAQVWHHRRDSIGGYLRQQWGYGRAEKILSSRHPHRFNRLGQARWAGFIYGGPRVLRTILRPVVYHGHQGTAPYQMILKRPSEVARNWATAFVPLLVLLSIVNLILTPVVPGGLWLGLGFVALVLGYGLTVAMGTKPSRHEPRPIAYRALVARLHMAQPLVRTWGRLAARAPHEHPTSARLWTGDRNDWLRELKHELSRQRCGLRIGSHNEPWDLEVTVGPFVACRVHTAVTWNWNPVYRLSFRARVPTVLVIGVAVAAFTIGAGWLGTALLGVLVSATALDAVSVYKTVRSSIDRTLKGVGP